LWKPDACSVTGSTGFNGENVKGYFRNLFVLTLAHNITANKMCNQYETGNTCGQISPKIMCAKGIKQVEECGMSQ